jgi:hypothetical protein
VRVGIIAIAKNEARYLLEWVAFHRAVGIRRFFIADNGGDDGTSELLIRLDQAGHIVRFDFRDRHPAQLAAYNDIVPRLRGALDLAVIIDVDEFVRPLASDRADTFFAEMFSDPNVSALALNWACYGSSGRVESGRGLVTTHFKRRAEQDFGSNRHIKTVVRVDRFVCAENPHLVRLSEGRYVDVHGEDITEWHPKLGPGVTTQTLWHGARVDHFLLKSLEEFNTIKRPRGRADLPRDHRHFVRSVEHFTQFDRNEVLDPMPARLVWKTRLQLLRIRWRFLKKERGMFTKWLT